MYRENFISLNTLIFFVVFAYRTSKYIMYCRLESVKETNTSFQNRVKESIYVIVKLLKDWKHSLEYELFYRKIQILYIHITKRSVNFLNIFSSSVFVILSC